MAPITGQVPAGTDAGPDILDDIEDLLSGNSWDSEGNFEKSIAGKNAYVKNISHRNEKSTGRVLLPCLNAVYYIFL